ncbi:hypothetical protein VT84_00705 [Gemmata sp. SH-PL17]|uniref:DUF7002 family protein n=1 Tax=Gemmata sp. SH-PL17 TaxID=1630693 RepID=UPI0004B41431|nr:hypothetical protein [Gemmata sp. SH-PL17]AMV22897.1 hypothetical protein VT84_00705 [Gemmata sp. SH-PL17]
MPFTLARFAALRPALFHITRPANLESIRARRRLICAAELFTEAGEPHRVREPRGASAVPIRIADRTVLVNDQRPLRAEWIDFEDGWDLPRLVAHLNSRVFFWPGAEHGPNKYGQNHTASYERHGAVILRVNTQQLLAANPGAEPEFCRYNSGAPSPRRRPNPRGPHTFLSTSAFDLPVSRVAEVTFPGHVALPDDTLVRIGGNSRWAPLFG